MLVLQLIHLSVILLHVLEKRKIKRRLAADHTNLGVCVLGERLFAVGGYDGSGYLPLVESYDSR